MRTDKVSNVYLRRRRKCSYFITYYKSEITPRMIFHYSKQVRKYRQSIANLAYSPEFDLFIYANDVRVVRGQ
jgi:hypothetical protein